MMASRLIRARLYTTDGVMPQIYVLSVSAPKVVGAADVDLMDYGMLHCGVTRHMHETQ